MEQLVLFWRENPCQAAEDIFGVELDNHQRIVVKSRWTHSSEIDILSRGTGKTFLGGLHAGLRGILYPGNRIGLIAPSFRQSKLLFSEVEKLYERSPLFQESLVRAPAKTADSCYCKFRAAEGQIGSYIEALPLGADGAKIRGSRFWEVIADEAAQIDPIVLNTVVRGFLATSQDPMANVRLMRELEASGLSLEEALKRTSSNKYILSSTAFFQWNHLWGRVSNFIETIYGAYKKKCRSGEDVSNYTFKGGPLNDGQIPYRLLSDGESCLTAFTYKDPSPGFMNVKTINKARQEMSDYEFRMEYCFAAGTEIITPTGLVPIERIQIGDWVLTHRGRFRPVLQTMSRQYSGPIVSMLTYGYNRRVFTTPEHPWWQGADQWLAADRCVTETKLTHLKEISGKETIDLADYCADFLESVVDNRQYLYPRPSGCDNIRPLTVTKAGQYWRANYYDKSGTRRYRKMQSVQVSHEETLALATETLSQEIGDTETFTSTSDKLFKSCVPRHIALDEDFGLIIGYYAAEGSVGADGRAATFSLDGHHDIGLETLRNELSSAIQRVFGKFPADYDTPDDNVTQITINSRLVTALLKSTCPGLSDTKVIQPGILFSNPAFMRGVIRGYWHGDGCINDKPQAIAGCVNRHLLTQIRLCLSYFEFASSLRDVKTSGTAVFRGRSYRTKPVHALEMKGDQCRLFAKWLNGVDLPAKSHTCGQKYIQSNNECATLRTRKHEPRDWSGTVYNLEVAEDNSYSLPNGTVHNCALFPADSEGFYRRSLLDASRRHAEFGPILTPRKGCLYALGLDPARSGDNFAISIYEIDPPEQDIRLGRVMSWNHKNFPLMASNVRKLIKHYGIKLLMMDAGGGGTTIRDLLASPENCPAGERLILEQDFSEHQFLEGDRILGPLVQFSNYDWVHDTNHNLKAALQNGRFKTAAVPPVAAHQQIWTPELDEADEEMERALVEWSSIIVVPAGSRMRWDTPSKHQRKDRYSAILIGFYAASILLQQQGHPQGLPSGFWA